ncbi:hypothetical protein C1H46_041150 [Malus baccata]|uniref:Uncharacterized protein n=1 Tax=Malus baccata TaxID=106549 RepID=A0A540KGL0_MALBA|nr:hypothetical protein C1H46_041150 [Malus baccata]
MYTNLLQNSDQSTPHRWEEGRPHDPSMKPFPTVANKEKKTKKPVRIPKATLLIKAD